MSLNLYSNELVTDLSPVEYKEYILDNGMKVVLCKTGNIPVAAVNTTFHVGSKDEEVNKTGMAHLFEHLMFEGSPNVPKGKFDEILSRKGGESNAYTTRDVTSYYITIPSNHLETALWLDSDRINGFSFSEDCIRIQKDVILEEKLLYVDNTPYGTIEEESSKRLFPGNSYSWPVIGKMEDLESVTREDLKKFFEKHYVPENAVISVAGDIDYDKTLSLIEKYYGSIPKGSAGQTNNFSDAGITSEITAEIPDNIHLEGKFVFYKLPARGTKEYYSMGILDGILSEGDSSRLYQELEYKNELVNEIDSSLHANEHASLFIISALALKGKKSDIIQKKIDAVIEDIKNGNISDDEFQKIINKTETQFHSKRLSIVSLADRLTKFMTYYNSCSKINDEITDYLSVTKKDIVETANKFLNKNQRLILNYKPRT